MLSMMTTILHPLLLPLLQAGVDDDAWGTLGQQTVAQLRQRTPKQPTSHLLKALLHQHLTKLDRQVSDLKENPVANLLAVLMRLTEPKLTVFIQKWF